MSIKNIFLIICVLTSFVFPAIAVQSSNASISITKNNSPKLTLKERLLVSWAEKKLRKTGINPVLPPDLKQCLSINLKNRRVIKGYEVKISDTVLAFKNCNSNNNSVTELNLTDIKSVTSTSGDQVYFENTLKEKVTTPVNSEEKEKIHPALIAGFGLTLAGIAASIYVNILFGIVLIFAGVFLAIIARKFLKKKDSQFKGAGLASVITGLGAGLFFLLASVWAKHKR